MYKMVVSDVDGTLVEEGSNVISAEYYDVIKALHKKGIQVIVATGRSYSSAEKLFEPVKNIVWFVCDGGSIIKTTGELEVLSDIPTEDLHNIWEDISKIDGVDAMVCGEMMAYSPFEGSDMYNFATKEYKMAITPLNGWENKPKEKISKVSIFRREEIEKYVGLEFLPKWKDKMSIVQAGEFWVDIMMPGINKAFALEHIFNRFGVDKNQVLATGDNMNDIEMLKLVGTGLAVSTAKEEVKAIADGVIGNYDNDAVLNEWKKLL